jgi:hypothetical protein
VQLTACYKRVTLISKNLFGLYLNPRVRGPSAVLLSVHMIIVRNKSDVFVILTKITTVFLLFLKLPKFSSSRLKTKVKIVQS